MKGSYWVSNTKGKVVQNIGVRGNSKHAAADSNRFKKLKEHIQKYESQIKAFKRSKNIEDDTDKEELNAGYQIGGET